MNQIVNLYNNQIETIILINCGFGDLFQLDSLLNDEMRKKIKNMKLK